MVQKGRLRFLSVVVTLVLLAVSTRLVWIQGVKAQEIAAKADEVRIQTVTLNTLRGSILDRNLKPLAMSVPYYLLVADHFQIQAKDEEMVASKLAELIGANKDDILKKLHDNPKNGYIKLQDKLTLEQKQKIDAVKPPLPGLSLIEQDQRVYPGHTIANQVLGYMAPDGKGGEAGLEKSYDQYLAGQPGYVTAEFTQGQTAIESTIKDQKAAVPGQSIVLSLDMALQKTVEQKLDQVVKDNDAKRASMIVMDAHTGEIVVMAMRPGADPGDRSTWGDPVDWNRIKNWDVGESMPPGSIFKTVTTSAALETGAITLTMPFYDTGLLPLKGCPITDWDGYMSPNPAPMTIAQLLQRSSNVGLVQVGQKITHDNFVKYVKAFGFFDKTGIDLDYEEGAKGLENFDQKGECDWANMYIGQHLEVTPLQMITAFAAVANGGYLVQPHLVKERRDPDGKVVWTAPTAYKRQVITAQTAKEVRDLEVSVIEKGTATAAKLAEYTLGGKTGTAQKFLNGVMKDRMLADFISFVPASNPQYVALIDVDEPAGQGYGGVVAAPVYADLMPTILHALGVPPDKNGEAAPKPAPAPSTSVVPDVAWMPVPWAQARLSDAGFVPRVKGDGTLVGSQSLQAGSSTRAGNIVELGTLSPKPNDTTVHVPDFTGLSLTEANRLATEIGLTLTANGSGIVSDQNPKKGSVVPARSTFSVTLAPRP